MKEQQDYIKDLAEIRSMMERSSKFLSLSGLSGVLAGVYAMIGAYAAYYLLGFAPDAFEYAINESGETIAGMPPVMGLALMILVLSIGTALVLTTNKAKGKGESVWNITSKRMLSAVSIPLMAGGIVVLLLIGSGFAGLAAPLTLVFYGITLSTASAYTYADVKYLGILQIVLGVLSVAFVSLSILFWAIGFGLLHIVYGLYIHLKHER